MKERFHHLLRHLEKNEIGISNEDFDKIVQHLGFKLPESYASVIKTFNGGEGEVGTDSWLNLFSLEELNEGYDYLMSEIPDYVLFGKDSADTGYAFHKFNGTFHSFGLLSNFKTDPIEFLGNDLLEFLEYLDNYKYKK